MISTYKRASIAHKTNGLLFSHDEIKTAAMNVQAKHERIKRAKRLSYKMKLSAMLTSDNRTGKIWA